MNKFISGLTIKTDKVSTPTAKQWQTPQYSPGMRSRSDSIADSIIEPKSPSDYQAFKEIELISGKNEGDKNKNQRYEKDFLLHDQDQRNLLHRASLEQNVSLIQDVLDEYLAVISADGKGNIQERLQKYILLPDIFGCTAILICCFLNEQKHTNQNVETERCKCLRRLIEKGADVNSYNPNNLWGPLHWCAYYGDAKSVELLINHGAYTFIPDRAGQFPLDLAGINKHSEVVVIITTKMIQFQKECQKFLEDRLPSTDEDHFITIQGIINDYLDYVTNPILVTKILYWCCSEGLNDKIDQLLQFPRIYIQAPLYTLNMTNVIHACVQSKNLQALEKVIQHELDKKHDELEQVVVQPIQIMVANKNDKIKYKYPYIREIKDFNEFEKDYYHQVAEFKLRRESKDKHSHHSLSKFKSEHLVQINRVDFYGNSALHMASLNGATDIIKFLVTNHGNPEVENKEFFKARQLTQEQAVLDFYREFVKEQTGNTQEIQEFQLEVKKIVNKLQKSQGTKKQQAVVEDALVQNVFLKRSKSKLNVLEGRKKKKKRESKPDVSIENPDKLKREIRRQLRVYSTELFVPDIVLKCKIKSEAQSDNIFNISGSKMDAGSEYERLNFQISLLQNSGFEIYLMKSFIEVGYYYIMMRHDEDNLETQAELMEMQIKLIDSYDLEPFTKVDQQLFEPFRSRQRQLIVENHIIRTLNLDQLLKSEVIETYYPMHTAGGIQIVKKQWQSRRKEFQLPQPLNQIMDYVKEGRGQNFTSLTTMRLYFGEKISFFFAWKSYLTCALLFVAIPGLALQIYLFQQDTYESEILPYWVFYICIWSTIQVEFWKRKTSEINTRWGCIDLMLDEESSTYMGPLKQGFSGDEEISFVTGKLTKHQKLTKTAFLFVAFLIIIALFLAASVGILLGIDQLRREYEQSTILSFSIGALQAGAIVILNALFPPCAKFFALKENHKYEKDYENSLISKNVVFKLANSYLPVFYIMLIPDYDLKDLFYFLLPLLLVKQVYSMLLDVIIPTIYMKLIEWYYFKHISNLSENRKDEQTVQFEKMQHYKKLERKDDYKVKSERQNEEDNVALEKVDDSQHILEGNNNGNRKNIDLDVKVMPQYLDPVEQFWSNRIKTQIKSIGRPVIKIQSDEIINETLKKREHISVEFRLDTDAVELNSRRIQFEGTLDYFMEGMIDYGFITLFAAAFPMGPAIGCLTNIIEIQLKINKLLYINKRVRSERCAGIGEWMNILEFLSVFSVFTNFALLYFKYQEQTLEIFQQDARIAANSDWKLWLFLISIIFLLFVKYLISELIPDRPQWVIQEIDKINHKSEIEFQRQTENKIKSIQSQVNVINKNIDDCRRVMKEKDLQYVNETKEKSIIIRNLNAELEQLQNYSQQKTTKKQTQVAQVGKNKGVATEYDMIILGVLHQRFLYIDRLLVIKRILQIIDSSGSLILICQECGEKCALMDCIDCDQSFCAKCYQTVHVIMKYTQHNVHLLAEPTSLDETDIQSLILIKQPSTKQTFKFTKEQKQLIEIGKPKREWKKLEYFSFPVYEGSLSFKQLKELFYTFRNIYIQHPGFEFRDFKVDLLKILQIDNYTVQSVVDDKTFKLEDKLFLNRIAFLVFKRTRHLAEVSNFHQKCQVLQDGLIEQRLILLNEFLDKSDNQIVTRDELESMFLVSFLQNSNTTMRVSDLLNQVCTSEEVAKKEMTYTILSSTNKQFRALLEGLVQGIGSK